MAKKKERQATVETNTPAKEVKYLYFLTRGYVIFVLAVMPLIVGPRGYDDIIFSKTQIYWAVTMVFLFAFMLFYLVYRLGGGRTSDGVKWYKKFSVPDWAIISFFTVITISSILSPYQNLTWFGIKDRYDGWFTMFCMMVCYFPVSRCYKPKQIDLSLYAISASIFCVIGYLQFYGYDFMNLFPYNRPPYADNNGVSFFSGYSIHFRSTIGNIDFVSAYVCMAVLAFGVLYIKTKGSLRFLYFAASVMSFIMMIISNADAGKIGVLGSMILIAPYLMHERESASRTFILSALFGLSYTFHHWFMINKIMPLWDDSAPVQDIIMRETYSTLPLKPVVALSIVSLVIGIAIFLLKRWPKPKTAMIAGLVAMLVIISCGLLGVEVTGEKLPQENMIHQAREVMHGNMEDSFGSNRGYIWRNALNLVPSQPLFGTGQDTFMRAFSEDIQKEAQERYGVYFDKAHNDFIQILICNGILGLVSYIVLIAGITVFSLKPAFHDPILLMAFSTTLAYLGQSLFGIDSITVTPIFWLMISITRTRQIAAAGSKNEEHAPV